MIGFVVLCQCTKGFLFFPTEGTLLCVPGGELSKGRMLYRKKNQAWTLSQHFLLGLPYAGSEVAVLAVYVRFEHLGLGIFLCFLCELD